MADEKVIIDSLGCHLSWPELRPYVADKTTLSREEGILSKEKWDFNDRPTYYTAVRNMQGFIAYHLNKYDEALGFFHEVLDKDKNNINALGNLAFIHNELSQMEDYQEYHNRLTQILTTVECNAERATAYVDKAHAIRYLEHKLNFRYMRFIKKAVAIGRQWHDDSDDRDPLIAEWLFDYALALYKKDFQMLYLRKLARGTTFVPEHSEWYSDERILKGFKEACRVFLEVESKSTSLDYQALSRLFLGILVNHDPEHRNLGMAFPNDPHFLTADQCFKKCLQMHPEHIMINRRVGYEYVKMGDFDKGRPFIEKSLQKSQSHVVYRYRAHMFVAMYEAAQKKDMNREGRKEWLYNAVVDFTNALEIRNYSADYAGLGYVYFLLGNIKEAIQKYSQAIRSEHDHFFDPVQTHQRWAKCLEMTGQSEGSQLQLWKAEEARRKILNTTLVEDHSDYFTDDFDHYSTVEKPDYVRILRVPYFVAFPPPQHPAGQRRHYPYDFFLWFADRDSQWAEAFVNKLESEHGLRACLQSRNIGVGQNVFKAFLDCLEKSHKFVVVLTSHPHPVDGTLPESEGWESYAISLGLKQDIKNRGGRGEYIVPIKLRGHQDFSLPETLQTVNKVFECEAGQFLKEDFDRLVRELTQEE